MDDLLRGQSRLQLTSFKKKGLKLSASPEENTHTELYSSASAVARGFLHATNLVGKFAGTLYGRLPISHQH